MPTNVSVTWILFFPFVPVHSAYISLCFKGKNVLSDMRMMKDYKCRQQCFSLLMLVCVMFDLHVADREDTAEPVLDDWSLLQESLAPDIAADTSVEPSVIHTKPPPPWNTTSVRKDLHPMGKKSFSVHPYWICSFLFSHLNLSQEESRMDLSYPEPFSEDSMLTCLSRDARETSVVRQTWEQVVQKHSGTQCAIGAALLAALFAY